jgi:mannosyl-3-phosphoglycerate phosphatase
MINIKRRTESPQRRLLGALPGRAGRITFYTVALVIFTDLDGALLDGAYSYRAALPALRRLARAPVPCVICSGKTSREIEHYRKKLHNRDPFCSENGGGIFLPKRYFASPSGGGLSQLSRGDGPYEVVRLGVPYARLREALVLLRAKGFDVTGFGDMSAEEIAARTGLPLEEAVMAKEREFDEPFLMEGARADRAEIARAIEEMGLAVTEGRLFFHLTGGNNKGKAVAAVKRLFKEASTGGNIVFAGLGDGLDDLSMLESVDLPIVVRRPDGTYDPRLQGRGFVETEGVGPAGWNRAVLSLLNRESSWRP